VYFVRDAFSKAGRGAWVRKDEISPPPLEGLSREADQGWGEGENLASSPRLVIGIGNPDRGDDGVGRLVAQRLRGNVTSDVRIEEHDGSAASLIELLRGVDSVFLIDAAVSGAPAGTIQETNCTTTGVLPTRSGASSHGFGVAEAIALTRTLHGLPRVCLLYTVEGVTFAPGAAMSQTVLAAADTLVERLLKELRSG
jgi:hydrogenase maturation protease